MHTTNYFNTFIAVADDCPVEAGEEPVQKTDKPSIAYFQFKMISENPYKYTSDDVLFEVFASRNDLTESEKPAARRTFFSKGQACMRSSPLGKRYGWGVHADKDGKIAIYPSGSEKYNAFVNDPKLEHTKAMRSKKL